MLRLRPHRHFAANLVSAFRHHFWRNCMSSNRPLPHLLIALLLVVLPTAAEAHVLAGEGGGFLHGFEHPLSGLDHMLAMFCVGLWGAQMGGRSVWSLPIAFPLIMVAGGMMGIAGIPLPAVESGIALSIIVLGAAIACLWRPPEWLALVVIGVFAIFHGYAHGAELPNAADPADYALGFVVATGLIHLAGIAVGLAFQRVQAGQLARALGGLIGLGGVYFLIA
jgi:urease accessory protein